MLSYNGKKIKLSKTDDFLKTSPFDFSKNTTYGLGGKAERGYFPKTVIGAKMAYEAAVRCGKVVTVGCGSNLLASDKGFDGSVISTKAMQGIVRLGDNRLFCLAGTTVGQLLSYCKKHCLGGLEYLYGIPATVGGAVFMNAGVNGRAIGDNIYCVHIYDGKKRVLTREMCKFGYRRSTMRDINALILAVIVNVDASTSEQIDKQISFYRDRREHLPHGKSCGCVFKNPSGLSAGRLIDEAGMKGKRVGGAYVSLQHGNFIINDGGSARDVRALIEIVKGAVFKKFSVMLEEEVVYIGDFNEFNG